MTDRQTDRQPEACTNEQTDGGVDNNMFRKDVNMKLEFKKRMSQFV